MSQDTNRLLMELEHAIRAINHEVINPQISELTVDDLRPVLHLVANAPEAADFVAGIDIGLLPTVHERHDAG